MIYPGLKMGNPTMSIREVCLNIALDYYKQPRKFVISKMRDRIYVEPRQLYAYLAYMFGHPREGDRERGKQFTSLNTVAEFIGKDHATVLNSIKRIRQISETDANFNKKRLRWIEEITAKGYLINKERMKKYVINPIYLDK